MAAVLALYFLGPTIAGNLKAMFRMTLGAAGQVEITQESVIAYSTVGFSFILQTMMTFVIIVVVVALAANISQVGFLITGHPLVPNLGRLNPITGLKRLVSVRSFVRLGAGIVKLIILGIVLVLTIHGEMATLMNLSKMELPTIVGYLSNVCLTLAFRAALLLLIFAILEYGYQRWEYERDIRMSKEEIKEELKRYEGDPKIRARRREVQRKLAVQRMMQRVPKADVVITNPTEIAVAIEYDEAVMDAPRVIAKGRGYVAERIRQIAEEHGIPIVERRELAQALYKMVEVGQTIPPQFYEAVAEILAYVYRQGKKKLAFAL